MSETLRDLVVSLSLQTDNFTRNIKSQSSTETGAAVVLNLPGKCLSENPFT